MFYFYKLIIFDVINCTVRPKNNMIKRQGDGHFELY